MIHQGDCIEVMRGMEGASVDAVVTDPPYGLEFMGKAWDKFGDVRRANRGDMMNMKTPSGKPKFNLPQPAFDLSLRASLAFQAWCQEWGTEALRVTKPGGYLLAFGGTRTHHRLVCGLEDAGWIIRDELDWIYASGFPKGKANLKPAHEPIVLARKPGPLRPLNIEESRIPGPVPSVPQPVFNSPTGHTYGMKAGEGRNGEMSRTEGRWPSNLLLSDPELFDEPNPWVVGSGATATSGTRDARVDTSPKGWSGGWAAEQNGRQRDEYDGDAGGYSRFFVIPKSSRSDREPVLRGQLAEREAGGHVGQKPGKRMGRTAEEGANVRDLPNRENSHATVKPTDLMRHLIRLVTPPGGTVLDPFLGSGTTAIAAELEGFPWVGIEKEPEYVAIAEARLNGTQRGLGLDVGAPTSQRKGRARPDSKIPEWPKEGWKDSSAAVFRGYTPDEEPAA